MSTTWTGGSEPVSRAPSSIRSSRGPALRAGRGAAEQGDGALERGPLGRHGAGVVARIRLLLVRGVVLLVDADQAEVAHGREDGRARTDDDARVAGHDALRVRRGGPTSVRPEWSRATPSPKRARKRPTVCGVSAISGTSTIASAAARERRRAGLEVDLGLTAARLAVEQERAAAVVQRRDDAGQRFPLRRRSAPPARASPGSACTSRPRTAAPCAASATAAPPARERVPG